MVNKYSKQHVIHTFTVGDYATLRMPWIDLASTVLQRLACVVVDIFGNTQSACIVLGAVLVSFRGITMLVTLRYLQKTSAYQ